MTAPDWEPYRRAERLEWHAWTVFDGDLPGGDRCMDGDLRAINDGQVHKPSRSRPTDMPSRAGRNGVSPPAARHDEGKGVGPMAVAGGLPSLDVLRQLHQRLNILVAVLTLNELDTNVTTMLTGVADTAVTAEPLLAGIDPAVLLELRSAFTQAKAGRRDDARADLLMASRRLAVLLHVDRPRRAAAADEPTRRWTLES